jgi:prepilin-type N-terminal cleavage/methylation domain-containing protein
MRKHSRSTSAGFTLIELLVVIAIIGLLSSIVLASIKVARQKGRNAYIVTEVHQIQINLALYANDHNGNYPNPAREPHFYCIGSTTCTDPSTGDMIGDQLGLAVPLIPPPSHSLADLFVPKIAEATSFPGFGMSKFNNIGTSEYQFVYGCNSSADPCPADHAWVYFPQQSSNTTVIYAQAAGNLSTSLVPDPVPSVSGAPSETPTPTPSPSGEPSSTPTPSDTPTDTPTPSPT